MKTKEIIRKIIKEHQKSEDPYLLKVVAILSFRPFNMKGQEIEEIIGLLVKAGLKINFAELNPKVEVPQNKKAADIKFTYKEETRAFDIKSYGGSGRFQIATLKPILPDIRSKFGKMKEKELNKNEKTWLIDKVKEVPAEYILFFYFIREEEKIYVHIFDIEELDISGFKDKKFTLKKVGHERRPEIHIPITENSTLEVSGGGNPYNRGMWINKIKTNNDMKVLYKTGFVEQVLLDSIKLKKEFDSSEYIFKKAQSTIEIIKKYF